MSPGASCRPSSSRSTAEPASYTRRRHLAKSTFEVLLEEHAVCRAAKVPNLICAVGPDGKFTAEAPTYAGRWVKEADKDISRDLKRRGLLFHQEQYLHEYPFCWRADEDPLIQYPRKSWFIRTTQYKDQMLANNDQINWLPEHIKEGRFGNFLETNVDWALSRERYWGTPLPIWICESDRLHGGRGQLRRAARKSPASMARRFGSRPSRPSPDCRNILRFTSRTSTR